MELITVHAVAVDAAGHPIAGLTRALDSPHDATGIPLRAMAYLVEPHGQKAARVLAAAELDASRASLSSKGEKREARLEVSVVVSHRDSPRTFRHDEGKTSVANGEMPAWRALAPEFELPAGVSQAQVIVNNPTGNAVGSVTQRFEVPAPAALRVSTPILTDHLGASSATLSLHPALAAHRAFGLRGQLYCKFEALGAAPGVRAGLALRAVDGNLVRETSPTRTVASPDGRLVRLVGMALDGMAEGRYDLVLDVEDQISGARLERHEPFTLAMEPTSP